MSGTRARGRGGFERRGIGGVGAKTKQHEAAPIEVEDRAAVIEPHVRGTRTGTRRGHEIFRVIRMGRRAVGQADRRALVPIPDLEADGAEHAADAAHERFAHAPAYVLAGRAGFLDHRDTIAEFFVLEIEFGGHADVSDPDRPPFGVVG